MARTKIGIVIPQMRGIHDERQSYKHCDRVQSGGSLFDAKRDVPEGISIGNQTYWQCILDHALADRAEENRAAAETARQSAEANRSLTEQVRASSEGARQIDENSRDQAEQARASAETNRQSAEIARGQLDQARVLAESARQSAENTRLLAEQGRDSAESARQSAEAHRNLAEQQRVAAENLRIVNDSYRPAGSMVANAIKGVLSGEMSSASDVSPLEHSLQWTIFGWLRQSGSPTPAAPLDITAAGIQNTDGQYAVSLSRYGKNLFNGALIQGMLRTSGDILEGSSAWISSEGYIPVLPGSRYCISAESYPPQESNTNGINIVAWYDAKKSMLSYNGLNYTLPQITPAAPVNARYMRLRLGAQGSISPGDVTDLMVTPGETQWDYVAPAVAATRTVHLDSPLRGLRVQLGGNLLIDGQRYMADTLTHDGTVTRRVCCQTLNGTEAWTYVQDGGSTRARLALSDCQASSSALCTHYPCHDETADPETNACVIDALGNFIVGLDPAVHPDIVSFTAWLSGQSMAGTPVTVYYLLNTPAIEMLTAPEAVPALSPTITISCDGWAETVYNQDANAALARKAELSDVLSRVLALEARLA